MAENKYKKQAAAGTATKLAGKKKNTRPHRERKNPHVADRFAKLRHETNIARGKQTWVSFPEHTAEELDVMSDKEVLALPKAHWERQTA
jgi:hypothetical protein